MIAVSELRVGNFVSFVEDANKYKDYHQVTNIDTQIALCHNGDVDTGELFPIPLTPEILEKCGFVGVPPHTKDIFSYNGLSVVLTAKRGNLIMWHIDGQEPAELNRVTNYLHQLQNLYHALTSQELDTTRINQ